MEKIAVYEEMIWDDILEKEAASAISKYIAGAEGMKPKEAGRIKEYVEAVCDAKKNFKPHYRPEIIGLSRKGAFGDGTLNQGQRAIRLGIARNKNSLMRLQKLRKDIL